MAKDFGKTWWGQQWLNSLSNIDYSNRLPRGSSYARKGSVKNITIKENNIEAKVAGSRPQPYDVVIIIPPFFEAGIKKLIKAISEKPVVISKLLNRELDPELLSIAEHCGLKVFPKQWTDFKMQCSCPDWAVPCKHIAAVIYKVSAEIDNNPFLAFTLHRVDLISELKKENIHIQQENTEIPLLKSILLPNAKTKKTTPKQKETIAPNQKSHQKLNLSTLSPIYDPLIHLLTDAPVFYQNSGNFREKYGLALRKAARNAQRILQAKASMGDYFSATKSKSKKQEEGNIITHHTSLSFLINENNITEIVLQNPSATHSPVELIFSLWEIPISHINDYQPSVAIARSSLHLAMNLVANGAIVPQLVKLE